MTGSHEFFTTPGAMTSPGALADLLEGLPEDVSALRLVVQGLMIHIFWADRYGVELTGLRRAEVQLRLVSRQLERILELDPRPLAELREPSKRLVGNCRDFSVMLTAMLRHRGVPARARCGFARYFIPNHFEDHWVCEYWNAVENRWVLVDAQLDALQANVLEIQFDPLDVPRDEFIVGGKAWQMCRQERADPDAFGISDLHGLWFVRGDLIRDVASLNKVELLPWDAWGLVDVPEEQLSPDELEILDHMAVLTHDTVPAFEQVRRIYETDVRWRVPAEIRSYTPEGVKTIDLAPG
jgi:hypothetical protein